MGKKKASALASLLMILLASFVLVAPIPPASAEPTGTYRYVTMGTTDPPIYIIDDSFGALLSYWNVSTPSMLISHNITFSQPWNHPVYGWIVNLTVPHETYVGISGLVYDKPSTFWMNFSVSMTRDGYGWIFLNATGDVDCYTWSDNTTAYWLYPSPKKGEKAADHGNLPSNGTDGIAGTPDDGFGDGNPDPPGSSILILPTTMTVMAYDRGVYPPHQWLVFQMPWPLVYTTGTAYSLVNETTLIDDKNLTDVGEPWEYYAGLDHPGDKVGWGHQKSTAYVTYVCAWSMLNIPAGILGEYDLVYSDREKKVREDCLIADIDCNEIVDIFDIVKIGVAYGATEANFGPDKTPTTFDDKIARDANYDGRGDLKSERGVIDIFDLVRCAIDYGASLTPDCIIRP